MTNLLLLILLTWLGAGVGSFALAQVERVEQSKKQKFSKQLPGAVFSCIVWYVASWFFSQYLDNYNGFSTYGSMATIIIIMIYMYMMMYILMVGAYLNSWLGRSEKYADEESDN